MDILAPNLPVNAAPLQLISTKALHKCISSLTIMLAVLLPLDDGAKAVVAAFVFALLFYFGSLTVKIVLTVHDRDPELAYLMDTISLSCGTLALSFQLLVIVPSFGLFAILVWSICLVIWIIKSYRESVVALKRLCQSAVEELVSVFDKSEEPLSTDHEAGQQNVLP